jgi:hypothetical protein
VIHKNIFLAIALLLISGLACAQNDGRPQGNPKKSSCPSCRLRTLQASCCLTSNFHCLAAASSSFPTCAAKPFCSICGIRAVPTRPAAAGPKYRCLLNYKMNTGHRGFQVIGVSLDDDTSTEDISDYAREMNVNYPVVIGTDPLLKSATVALFFCR